MEDSDRIRLHHMLEAAREAQRFVSGKARSDLDTDRMPALSLVKEIEIIGEAAGKVSAHCRAQFPEIPWQDIVGTRNRLIHAYFSVDPQVGWMTVTQDLPPLIEALQRVLEQP